MRMRGRCEVAMKPGETESRNDCGLYTFPPPPWYTIDAICVLSYFDIEAADDRVSPPEMRNMHNIQPCAFRCQLSSSLDVNILTHMFSSYGPPYVFPEMEVIGGVSRADTSRKSRRLYSEKVGKNENHHSLQRIPSHVRLFL